MKWHFVRNVDLLGYLPPVLRDYEELGILGQVEAYDLIQALHDVNIFYSNIFIDTADEDALRIQERQWLLAPPEDASIEDRRLAVRARILSLAALYTKRSLDGVLTALCGQDGFTLEITYERFFVHILIELKSRHQADAVRRMLHDMLPANMVYKVDIRYNQHITLHKLTHGEMAAYTHDQLRNSVKVRELAASKE